MKVPGSKIVPCQGVLGANHSLTFGLFTQVSGSGPLGPLVFFCFFFFWGGGGGGGAGPPVPTPMEVCVCGGGGNFLNISKILRIG